MFSSARQRNPQAPQRCPKDEKKGGLVKPRREEIIQPAGAEFGGVAPLRRKQEQSAGLREYNEAKKAGGMVWEAYLAKKPEREAAALARTEEYREFLKDPRVKAAIAAVRAEAQAAGAPRQVVQQVVESAEDAAMGTAAAGGSALAAADAADAAGREELDLQAEIGRAPTAAAANAPVMTEEEMNARSAALRALLASRRAQRERMAGGAPRERGDTGERLPIRRNVEEGQTSSGEESFEGEPGAGPQSAGPFEPIALFSGSSVYPYSPADTRNNSLGFERGQGRYEAGGFFDTLKNVGRNAWKAAKPLLRGVAHKAIDLAAEQVPGPLRGLAKKGGHALAGKLLSKGRYQEFQPLRAFGQFP